MRKGWTRFWRKELDSPVWQMPLLYHRVWCWLQQRANWKSKLMPTPQVMGMWVSPGMLVTSYQEIAEGIAYRKHGKLHKPNKKTIMQILKWLEGNGMIQRESNGQGTIIYITNWHIHQPQENETETAENEGIVTVNGLPDGPLRKHQLDTTKEVLEDIESQAFKRRSQEGRREAKPKGVRSLPLEFSTYKEMNDISEDIAATIEYFLSAYKHNRGEEHPRLRPEQWADHCDTIMSFWDETHGTEIDLELEYLEKMIDGYFITKFEDCDYRLSHFNTDGIKMRRFYEYCY